MAELHTFTCDECGKIRGEKNHWFKLRANAVQLPWGFDVYPFDLIGVPDSPAPIQHLCSLECVKGKLTKWAEALLLKDQPVVVVEARENVNA